MLRVPVLYGPVEEDKESAVNVLKDTVWKAQEQNVEMDDWAQRYPTSTEDVARVIKDVAEKYSNASAEAKSGMPRILQFSSEDRYTKYQICELIADTMGLPLGKMVAIKDGGDPKAAVQRPYDTHLSTATLKALGINVSTRDFKAWW